MSLIKKNGFEIKKKFFSEKEISMIERNIIFFIFKKIENKDYKITSKIKKILKLSKNKFRLESIKILEQIEKKNKKLFYELSSNFENIFTINNIDQKPKNINFLKNYFGSSFFMIQRRAPIMLFNKKNLNRLKYEWHQESQFYPSHDIGLHMWFPLFRDIKHKGDGGMCFAKEGNKKNYKYSEFKEKNSWTQRIPKIDVEKNFDILTPTVSRGDVIFFEGKQLHKSDNQTNKIPRVSIVIRYLANTKNNFLKI